MAWHNYLTSNSKRFIVTRALYSPKSPSSDVTNLLKAVFELSSLVAHDFQEKATILCNSSDRLSIQNQEWRYTFNPYISACKIMTSRMLQPLLSMTTREESSAYLPSLETTTAFHSSCYKLYGGGLHSASSRANGTISGSDLPSRLIAIIAATDHSSITKYIAELGIGL